jgi:hypothetical protein
MNNILLRNAWLKKIAQMLPNEPETRRLNFVNLLVGIYLSASVHLKKIARYVPSKATATSIVTRLTRFLNNPGVKVETYYNPEAQRILQAIVAAGLEIRLIIDGSKVGATYQLLIVSVAFRRRAIPIAWIWVKHKKGHSTDKQQAELIEKVKKLLPEGAKVTLVGDGEFGRVVLIEMLEKLCWKYALRVSSSELYQRIGGKQWHKIGSAARQGETVEVGEILFTKSKRYRSRLITHWGKGEEEPWLIITNMDSGKEVLGSYKRRMWIEGMFGDMKGNGFNLEDTHLRDEGRLNRLTLAVCLLYLWLVAYGSKVIKMGMRHLVDRKDRRDLSIFRIGYDMMERHFTNGEVVGIFLCPYI